MIFLRVALAGVLAAAFFAGPADAAPRKTVLVKRSDIVACSDVIQTGGAALTVHAPILRYTVTSFNPNWFNPGTAGQGVPLFTLRISPQLQPYADRLTLRVRVLADTNLRGSPLASPVEVFDRVTQPLDAGKIGVPLTSGDVFSLDFQPGTDFRHSDFYRLTMERREVPQMNLRLEFSLFCSGQPVAENGAVVRFETSARIRHVRTVRAIAPGADVGGGRAATIHTVSPAFQVASELLNEQAFEYAPGEARLEIFVYQLEDGQDPRDAYRGLEHARFPVVGYPAVYPPESQPLLPGRSYVWRVRALLRGPESRYAHSNGLWFRVDPRLEGGTGEGSPQILTPPKDIPQQVRYGDDYEKRVLAALKLILGPNHDLVAGPGVDKVPAQGLIRLNGQPYSLEELEQLARRFHAGRLRVTRLKFE